MQSSLPPYHIHCHKVRDLIQQSLFLDAMSKLSSQDFTSYVTSVSKNMTGVERGVISRLITRFYSHVLQAWQGRLQFRDKNLRTPDPLYNRQILLLQDLGQKSHQGLIIFQLEIAGSNANNSVIPLLHEILDEMRRFDTNLETLINDSKNTALYLPDNLMSEASSSQYLDLSIQNKRMESLRYFLYVQELTHVLHCEMPAIYLHRQTKTLGLPYIITYYENTIKSASLHPGLRDRILVALTEHLSQAFQIPFEVLVERICNQAGLTADEMCQFTITIAQTYYRRSPNKFLIVLERYRSDPLALIYDIIRSRLLVILSSVVVQKRCRESIMHHREISCWDLLSSASTLENITKLKIRVFSEQYKEDTFTAAEFKLYEKIPLTVAPLFTKYIAQFNEIFTNEELWKLNGELYGENYLQPLKWVHDIIQKIPRSDPTDTIDEESNIKKGFPGRTTVERIREKQEALIRNPPSGKINLEMTRALLRTYLLKATLDIDNSVLSEDPEVVIDSLLSQKTASDTFDTSDRSA